MHLFHASLILWSGGWSPVQSLDIGGDGTCASYESCEEIVLIQTQIRRSGSDLNVTKRGALGHATSDVIFEQGTEKSESTEKPENNGNSGETGFVVLALVAFVMAMFYMVNSHRELVVSNTWSMISTGVSIFCAVLGYNAVHTIVGLILGIKHAEGSHGPPPISLIVSRSMQLVAWWFFVTFRLFWSRNSLLHLKAQGTVGGHILGFAAIYLFGDIFLIHPFRGNPWMIIFVLGIYYVVFAALFSSTILIRKIAEYQKWATDKELERWHDESKETGIDFFSMCTGFLISFTVRGSILGYAPSIDGHIHGHTAGQAVLLLASGFTFLGLAATMAVAHHKVEVKLNNDSAQKPFVLGLIEYVSTTASTSAAFCLIFSLMWLLGQQGSKMLVQTLVAFLCSIVAIAFVFALTIIMSWFGGQMRMLRAAFTGVSLAVGLSWEKVFDAAVEAFSERVSEKIGGKELTDHLFTVFLFVVLLLVVFPAWMLYMLPRADKEIQSAMSNTLKAGGLPYRAICFDQDLYDDYEG